MLENSVIKESNNSYIFNIMIIKKKNKVEEGIDRLYVNYRPLNKISISDKYLLSNINEICSKFWKSK